MKCILANPGRVSSSPHLGSDQILPAINLAIPSKNPITKPDSAPAAVRPVHRIPNPNTIVIGGAR